MFVDRNDQGRIVALYSNPQREGHEWVDGAEIQPDPKAIIEAKKQTVRAMREQVLDRLAGIAGRAQRKGDTALAEACDTASEALLDITKDLPTDPDAVELELFSRYHVIAYNAEQAAPSLKTAFAQVDA
jgi:hypothetical protein